MSAPDPAQTAPAKEAMPAQAAEHEPLLGMWREYVDAEGRVNERGLTDDTLTRDWLGPERPPA